MDDLVFKDIIKSANDAGCILPLQSPDRLKLKPPLTAFSTSCVPDAGALCVVAPGDYPGHVDPFRKRKWPSFSVLCWLFFNCIPLLDLLLS